MDSVFKQASVELTATITDLASVSVIQVTTNKMELVSLVHHAHHQAQEIARENVSVMMD